jgi:hypothetical protein
MTNSPAALVNSPGAFRILTVPNPAAGAEFSFTILAGMRLELLLLYYEIAANATTVARRARFTLSDGSNIFYRTSSQSLTTASATHINEFFHGTIQVTGIAGTDPNVVPIPQHLILLGGFIIASDIGGLQATDQLQNIHLSILDWTVAR